jgi:hypothetical protein
LPVKFVDYIRIKKKVIFPDLFIGIDPRRIGFVRPSVEMPGEVRNPRRARV